MVKALEPGTVYENLVTQLPFTPIKAVCIINIHFCIYSVTELSTITRSKTRSA